MTSIGESETEKDSGLGRGVQPASGKSEGGGEADGPITWREFENDPQSGEEGPWFILCMNGEPWMQVDSYFGTEYLPDWISDYDGDEAQARDNLEHRMRRRCKLANAAIASAANTQNKGSGE